MKLSFSEINSNLLKCLITLKEIKLQTIYEYSSSVAKFNKTISLTDTDIFYGGNSICRYLSYSNMKSRIGMNLEIDNWLEYEENILTPSIIVFLYLYIIEW